MRKFIAIIGFALTATLATQARTIDTSVTDVSTFVIHNYDLECSDLSVAVLENTTSISFIPVSHTYLFEGSGYYFDAVVVDFAVDYINRQTYRIEGPTKLPNTYSNIKSKFLWLINCSIKQC